MTTFYVMGHNQVRCTGPVCPLCASGLKAKQRVVVNARGLGKTLLSGQTYQLPMSRRTYDSILAVYRNPTRWQRLTNFFRRILWRIQSLLSPTKTSKN